MDENRERIARLEAIAEQFNARLSKLENHYSDLLERVTKLEESIEWIKGKISGIDKRLWGIITGIIISILIMILKMII